MSRLIELDAAELYETFVDHGWTDGLPIVAPTPERVATMLQTLAVAPEHILGQVAERQREVTAEKCAINAVMAGCRPEYFPIVVTAVQAALDPAFNINTVTSSTGGPAICVIVSGPKAQQVGMNGRHNALGPGNRANATIGRAVRLLFMNLLDARPGEMDGSSLGNPGKYSLCFCEDPPPPPWQPLRCDLGYEFAQTTVTVLPAEAPHQIANHLNGDADAVVRTIAAAMSNPAQFAVGKGGQCVVVLGPEHAAAIVSGGLSRRDVQEALWHHSRVTPQQLEAAGVVIEQGAQHDMTTAADGTLPAMATPDDIYVVTAGGAGGGWSALLPSWAPILHSHAVTRRVIDDNEVTL